MKKKEHGEEEGLWEQRERKGKVGEGKSVMKEVEGWKGGGKENTGKVRTREK